MTESRSYVLKDENSASADLLREVLLAIRVERRFNLVSDKILSLSQNRAYLEINLIAVANHLNVEDLKQDARDLLALEVPRCH